MPQISCPACQRVLKLKAELLGKQVACVCGKQFRIPQSPSPSSPPHNATAGTTVQSPATRGKVILACSCGKRLAAPESARGRQVRCPCGKSNTVPLSITAGALPLPAAQKPVIDNWLDDLPDPHSLPSQAQSFSQPMPPYAQYSQTASYNPANQNSAIAISHLANAQRDLVKERHSGQSTSSGSDFFNGQTISGLLTMFGAVAWFVGGLMFGVLFFYPPILFVIGLVTFAKGLMTDD